MARPLHLGTCPRPPHKRKYATALDVLIDHQRNPRKIRAYQCQHCKAWHATSKPLRKGSTA